MGAVCTDILDITVIVADKEVQLHCVMVITSHCHGFVGIGVDATTLAAMLQALQPLPEAVGMEW